MGKKPSYEKINYLLRPAKQLERKLLIEALHRLGISDYGYVGFGSVYYADFILFLKYLYMSKMTCLEKNPIENRMKFNKPYKFIKLKMMPASKYIPLIPKSKPIFAWLDYDSSIEPNMLEDIDGFIQKSPEKSILIFTIDARAKIPEEEDDPSWNDQERLIETVNYYNEYFHKYIGRNITADDLSDKAYPNILAGILKLKIQESMLGRDDLSFKQMFNFLYSDNAPMLTFGGILIDNNSADSFIEANFQNVDFICQDEAPIKINVPLLTDRERKWIDSHLVGNSKKLKIPFEIGMDYISAYSKYAKHYPTYHEIVV